MRPGLPGSIPPQNILPDSNVSFAGCGTEARTLGFAAVLDYVATLYNDLRA